MRDRAAERRRFTRVQTALSARWHRAGEQVEAVARELTLRGGFLICQRPPRLGEEAALTLATDCAHAVRLVARVVRICETPEGPGFAVTFVGLCGESRLALANHLLRRTRERD